MKSVILFLSIFLFSFGIYIFFSLRLSKAGTNKINTLSYFCPNQAGLDIAALIFMGSLLFYSIFETTSEKLVWAFILALIIGMVIYFDPYLLTIKEGNVLEIKTVAKSFMLPTGNIRNTVRFVNRVYIFVENSGFPFGMIPIGSYYLAEDPELEAFVVQLQKCMGQVKSS